MFYRKNVPGWERLVRVVAGIAMIVCGMFAFPGTPIGYLIACAGVVTLITGFVGYCPACAVAGRKTTSSSPGFGLAETEIGNARPGTD